MGNRAGLKSSQGPKIKEKGNKKGREIGWRKEKEKKLDRRKE